MGWKPLGFIFNVDTHAPSWVVSHAMMPLSIETPEGVVVFFTGRDAQGISAIGRFLLCSETLQVIEVSNSPLLVKGNVGCFDDCGVLGSWVLRTEREIRLYYNGYNVRNTVPWSNAIGLSISNDNGKTLERLAPGPILDRSINDPYFVVSPCVAKIDGIWQMIYTSGTGWVEIDGKVEPQYKLNLASSEDGIHWRPDLDRSVNLRGINPGESVARAVLHQEEGCFYLYVIVRDDRDFRDGAGAYRINRFSLSGSGLSEWEKDIEFEGIPTSDGCDDTMQCYPFILHREGKPNLMFYNGNSFGKQGILAAEYEL